ncbi:mRNA splicing factor Cwf18-like protein [Dioscorea alata]|uniref:mRNA splicing factor Cwf18-like protein n=1 Tax=Dioscorea alata TaxID=55571 RepID=A0ACB7V6L2_DIOAL|nr:mRNA splicing factor Cwf18-like protein [Dioscorea alata]
MAAEEEDSSGQASNSRRERLKALRAAQDLLNTPDEDGTKPQDPPEDQQQEDEAAGGEDKVDQAAAARRLRLQALKEANELLSTPDEGSRQDETEETEDAEEEMKFNLKFRNYLPHDEELQRGKLPPAVLPKFEDPVAPVAPLPENIEVAMQDPFVNIAPKKPNWDLRRDVQKRLEKLEKRTQIALRQLMLEQEKEREASEAGSGVTED